MDISRLAEVLGEVVKRLDQTQNEKNKLDHMMERLDTLQNYIEEVKDKLKKLDQKTDFIKTKIVETRDKSSSEVEVKDGRTLQGKIEQVKTSTTSLAGRLDTLEKSVTTVVQKIDSVRTSLNDGLKTLKEDLSLIRAQGLITTNIVQSTNEVNDNIYRGKHEIFAVTDKDAQIVRERIEEPLGKYSFDFYVENFKTLVRSGKGVYSPLWHINEAKTSVVGCVWFREDGNIKVSFNHGRHPREVGLQRRPARRLKVKATICDVRNKVLPGIVLGEGTTTLDETDIPDNGVWGPSLGVTSCDDLINKGYGEKEGYWWGAILVRYDVTVL